MGLLQWIKLWFRGAPSGEGDPTPTAKPDFSIPIGADQSLYELVDFILDCMEANTRLDALCAYTSMNFGISANYAALAWDRVQEGIERAQTDDPTAGPNKENDPVAWISYQRAIAKKAIDPAKGLVK